MLLPWIVAGAALASPDAHYHPDAVAQASEAFRQTQDQLAPAFEAAQHKSRLRAAALARWQLSLDLLGDRAPEGERAILRATEQVFRKDQARVAAFASERMQAVEEAFQEALSRAVDEAGGADWPVCRPEPTSRGLRMGPSRRTPEPSCPGEDQSAALASAMDDDPTLRARIESMEEASWPGFTAAPAPGPATSGDEVIDLVGLLEQHAHDALRAIDTQEEQARLPIEAALEQDPSPEEIAALRPKAAEIREQTAAKRQALAAPVLDALDQAATRQTRRGGPTPAYCPRPDAFSGCDKPAMSPTDEEAYVTHPKVKKALKRAAR